MKKTLSIILAAMAIATLASCEKEPLPGTINTYNDASKSIPMLCGKILSMDLNLEVSTPDRTVIAGIGDEVTMTLSQMNETQVTFHLKGSLTLPEGTFNVKDLLQSGWVTIDLWGETNENKFTIPCINGDTGELLVKFTGHQIASWKISL